MNQREALELWFQQYLHRKLGVNIAQGVTSPEQRREAARTALLADGRAHAIAGPGQDRKPRTWSQLFAHVYQQPLEPAP